LKISFHGAAQNVTGSKHLIKTAKGKQILLDCGLFQGHGKETDGLNRNWGFDPQKVDYLILSHAHIDHCGLIPKLVKDGFSGPIFCTPGTFDLMKILLFDSAKIQSYDIQYVNKKRAKQHKELFEPLYEEEDVEAALSRVVEVEYQEEFRVNDDINFTFFNAGHIVGSASVYLIITEDGKNTRIGFTGDLGRYNDEIHPAPTSLPQVDILICESTYGDRLHAPVKEVEKQLHDIIEETCVKRKGNLVIPAFSVGRTQELVYALNRLEINKELPLINYYVDSPLSVEATKVVKKHYEDYNDKFQLFLKRDKDPFDFDQLHYVKEVEDSKAIEAIKEPVVIISSSGMADAGRVKHHIAHNIEDPRSTILIVGYCEPNSLGGRLGRGDKSVFIFGDEYQVKARIEKINSMSAHGDYNDMIRFLLPQHTNEVKKVFLVHGEVESQLIFAKKLQNLGFEDINVPKLHEDFNI
jgi:metallo-beta-lactamase family protein